MNHRELILSAQKKPRFAFLALPEDLQDEIVDGLDSGTLAMREASEMVKARGKSLSREGTAGWYRAVRRERSIYDTDGHTNGHGWREQKRNLFGGRHPWSFC